MSIPRKQLAAFREIVLDPVKFLTEIHVPTGRGNRKFGEVIADFQMERFNQIIPSLYAAIRNEVPPKSFHWWEATKGASKDSDLALCLLWLLLVSPRALRIQIGAYDQDQAGEIRLILKRVLAIDCPLNQYIAGQIKVGGEQISNSATGSTADILTRDAKGSHGSRPDVVLINELSHITDKEFAETLFDNADKVETAVVIIATNAGHTDTWQSEWKHNALTSDRWSVHEFKIPAPWISPAKLEESRRRNHASRYARLWNGIWTSGAGDAISRDLIDSAVTLAGSSHSREQGYAYFGGADLAWRRDAAAIVVIAKHVGYWEEPDQSPPAAISPTLSAMVDLGIIPTPKPLTDFQGPRYIPGTAKLKLVDLKIFLPGGSRQEIDFTEVEEAIAEFHSRYGFSFVAVESPMAQQPVQRLQKQNLPIEAIAPSSPNQRAICDSVLTAFAERQIDLFPHAMLLADLRNLRAIENAGGVRLQGARSTSGEGTPHGDAAIAFAHAVWASSRPALFQLEEERRRPLVCYP